MLLGVNFRSSTCSWPCGLCQFSNLFEPVSSSVNVILPNFKVAGRMQSVCKHLAQCLWSAFSRLFLLLLLIPMRRLLWKHKGELKEGLDQAIG